MTVAGALERLLDRSAVLERRARVQHDADAPSAARRRCSATVSDGQRLVADLRVLGRAVEQVDRVDHQRLDVRALHRLVEGGDLLVGVDARASTARGFWLKIWIERQPRSSPRSTAFAGPPAGETWAPINIG